MLKSALRLTLCLVVTGTFISAVAQTSSKPLRASEVLALEAGGALPANIVHHIAVRGLSFHPDDDFLKQATKAGADATVLAALRSTKVVAAEDAKPDQELLQQLSDAAVLMKG